MNTVIKIAVLVIGIFAGMGGFAHAADQTPTSAAPAAESQVQVPANSEVSVSCNRTNSLVAVKWMPGDYTRCSITVSLQGLAIAANTLGQNGTCFVAGDKRGKLIAVFVKKVGKVIQVYPGNKREGQAAADKLAVAIC